MVGLIFIHASVIQHGGLPSPHGPDGHGSAARATRRHARYGQQQGAEGDELGALQP